MESNSLPGRIHCSSEVATLIAKQAPELPLEKRGSIEVKGKGRMDTFWVHEGDSIMTRAASYDLVRHGQVSKAAEIRSTLTGVLGRSNTDVNASVDPVDTPTRPVQVAAASAYREVVEVSTSDTAVLMENRLTPR